MFRAIVIDDEIWALRGFINLLNWEELGIQIIGGYQDEDEALAAIREERPDIVISDVYLKTMKGNQILKVLKEENIQAETVLISAHRDFEAAQDSMRYSTFAYILKPYKKEEVREVFAGLTEKMKRARNSQGEAAPVEGYRCFILYGDQGIPARLENCVVQKTRDSDGNTVYRLRLPGNMEIGEIPENGGEFGLSTEKKDFSDLKKMVQEAKFSKWYHFRFSEDASIAEIERYICEHINETISLTDVAEHFYMSSAYLSYKFRKYTNITITDFIHLVKIEGAKRLIKNHTKLSEVAVQTGFSNYNYFGRLFKRYTGQSPEKYADTVQE